MTQVIDLKNILNRISPVSKRIFIIGFSAAVLIVAVSAVIYFGAGREWDYYLCISLSEKMLAASRPVITSTCICALLVEYRAKTCDKI